MEGLAVVGFVFGLAAFVRVEKLVRALRSKGILDHNYKANE